MTHLLVTNDFPPKLGGIQSYLWELWRRLPPDGFVVLTTAHRESAKFDAEQPFRVERVRWPVLLPTPATARRINALARDVGAGTIVLDPALPLGLVGRRLDRPYALVLHGAEVTVPARLPGSAALLRRVITGASQLIAAGTYPAAQARRLAGDGLDITVVPPGVDLCRFRPLHAGDRDRVRAAFGVRPDAVLVLSLSRLVPRKGMDVLIEASADLRRDHPSLQVLIGGEGRDRGRLARLIRSRRAPVRLLGRVPDHRLADLYGCADVFVMACRDRWGGLEQEGFGIVFLEAAACRVPQVAGDSGGASEAVVDGETGLVVRDPADPGAVARALRELLTDTARRQHFGDAARRRVEREFDYVRLAARLGQALDGAGGGGERVSG